MQKERDLIGYGKNRPNPKWPNQAKVAINFVINYEEGAELTPLNNDHYAECYGGEFQLTKKNKGQRCYSMESMFEYGSRAGIWRLIDLFDKAHLPLTFFITGFALTLNSDLATYLRASSHEIAGHGWRWIDYSHIDKKTEKKHLEQTIKTLTTLTNQSPRGWYTGRRSRHTRELIIQSGRFIYDSDSYADDFPYYIDQHLVIPYSLTCNDFRFTTSPGFTCPEDFYNQLVSTFNFLHQDPNGGLMSIGLHPRLSGHPGRSFALLQFIDYIMQHQDIWIARRIDIAEHWLKTHPPHLPSFHEFGKVR